MVALSPEEMAQRLIGTSSTTTAANLRAVVAEAITKDREMTGYMERPTGLPFDVVGTKAAHDALAWFNDQVGDDALTPICDAYVNYERHYAALSNLLPHRDHLDKQVTEAQDAATHYQIARRNTEARLRGVMAWVVGDEVDSNPYVREAQEGAWEAWAAGWHDANRADTMSTHRQLHHATAAGALAACNGAGEGACPYPESTMRAAWLMAHQRVQQAKGRAFDAGAAAERADVDAHTPEGV